ncbi:MAG: inositol 2-dehydrogenase [Acidobacteria bacterium]|nr:inositol 2-dehydrogenase [Acidobacteriota bacterium]MBS1866901.1 inositol 2-dehydrogenase [Acidobacteriota bacterium]
MTSNKLRIGIIGAGRIGKVHSETLAFRLPDAIPLAIADVNLDAASEVAERCHIPRVLRDHADILKDPEVDAVLICSPTETHADLIISAARAGKHIFCEKPIDHSLSKIDLALQAVKQARVKLQIGFNRRFDTNFARVHNAVTSGELGTPHLMHIVSRDPAPPPLPYIRASGGIFLDMTIHDFDMARFLAGSEVESLYASGAVRIDKEIEKAGDLDTAVIVLHFKNGMIGTIDNSRQAVYGYDQRVEILGSKGAIATENRFPNQVTLSTGSSIQRDLPLNFFMDRYAESFESELSAFVQAVLHDKPVPVTGQDGRAATVMALAARKSVELRRPVQLEEVGHSAP